MEEHHNKDHEAKETKLAEKKEDVKKIDAKKEDKSNQQRDDFMNKFAKISHPIIPKNDFEVTTAMFALVALVAVLLIFNQIQISSMGITGQSVSGGTNVRVSELSQITTTSQAVALLFPIDEINSDQDAINMMIPQGTPDYGVAMGVSFDDPIAALELLSSNYNTLKTDLKQNNIEVWERYLALATQPVGISCEFCCGVGPKGITNKGDLTCGCSHNPAAQSLTMLLMKDTNLNDAEVLKEVLKWKSIWFPRDMVGLALKASGGEIETALPGMVGGC